MQCNIWQCEFREVVFTSLVNLTLVHPFSFTDICYNIKVDLVMEVQLQGSTLFPWWEHKIIFDH